LNGGVGCGKTLLATSLYDCIPLRKNSYHFHEFMLDIHARIHSKRSAEHKIRSVALDISNDTEFLYLDEIQITDITDALLIRSLFQHLFSRGTILLLTSNRRPEKLYENGLQYELFQPVVPLLREYCRVYEMDATRDYRMLNSESEKRKVYLSDSYEFDDLWETLTNGEFPVREDRVPVYGGSRYLSVPMAIKEKGICYFSFNQLCDRPLSEADYIALCNRFHTIFLRDIPVIDPINMRNQSRRFRSFIDQAYRCKVKLVMNAPVPINQLFVRNGSNPSIVTEEMFESERIESRLQEMITDQYLESAWEPSR